MVIFQRFSIGSWLISRCLAAKSPPAEGDLPGAPPGRGAARWTAPVLAGYFAGGYLHGEVLEGAVQDGLKMG